MVLSSMEERQRSDGSFVYQVVRTWVVLRSSANKSKEMFPLVRVIFVVEYLCLKDCIMLAMMYSVKAERSGNFSFILQVCM